MQLPVWPWKSKIASLSAYAILILLFSLWSFGLVSSWQDPVVADQSSVARCSDPSDIIQNSSRTCALGADDSFVATEPPTDRERPDFDHYRFGDPTNEDGMVMASDTAPMNQRAPRSLDLYVDPYDPATWPDHSSENSEVEAIAPIDPYDPATWPGRETPDLDIQPVEPIDLFDATTWPDNDQGENEVIDAAPISAIDVYDASTWPQDGKLRDSADLKYPIDPYDPETWPKGP